MASLPSFVVRYLEKAWHDASCVFLRKQQLCGFSEWLLRRWGRSPSSTNGDRCASYHRQRSGDPSVLSFSSFDQVVLPTTIAPDGPRGADMFWNGIYTPAVLAVLEVMIVMSCPWHCFARQLHWTWKLPPSTLKNPEALSSYILWWYHILSCDNVVYSALRLCIISSFRLSSKSCVMRVMRLSSGSRIERKQHQRCL